METACTCMTWDALKALYYPTIATEYHIMDAKWEGINNNYEASEYWPECEQVPECADTELFNELLCQCLPDPEQTDCAVNPWCEVGELTNPHDPCTCITEENLTVTFPSWATMQDIYSTISSKVAPEPELDQCPWIEYQLQCLGAGQYWNELACDCFAWDECTEECADGQMRDPKEAPCGSCVDMSYVRERYFDNAASDDSIYASQEIAAENYIRAKSSDDFPECPSFDTAATGSAEDCGDYYYWNELSCTCNPNSLKEGCDACADDLYWSPVSFCDCQPMDSLADFFPGWATEDHIIRSMEPLVPVAVDPTTGEELETCPLDENLRVCWGPDLYWDELACLCRYWSAD